MSRLGAMFAAFAILFGLSACEPPSPTMMKSSVPVIGTSPVLYEGGPWRSVVFWLDENTLVFPVWNPGSKTYELSAVRIYLWRMGEEARPYAPVEWHGANAYLCADQGRITYGSHPLHYPDAILGYSGPPGEEKPALIRKKWADQVATQANYDDLGSTSVVGRRCDEYEDPQYKGRQWVASYSREAVLDFGPWRGKPGVGRELTPVVLHRGAKTVTLPISTSDGSSACTQTPAWDDSFFLTGRCLGYESRVNFRVMADGTVKTLSVPEDFVGVTIVPYLNGYLAFAAKPGLRGIYKLGDGPPRRIVSGVFAPAAVSPSGCRLAAFRVAPSDYIPSTLAVFDVCAAKS